MIPILRILDKYKGIVLLLIISAILYFTITSKDKQIAYLKNEYIKSQKIVQVGKTLFDKQALQVKALHLINDSLKNYLKTTKRQAQYFQRLSLEYKVQLGAISTSPADTVYITDSTKNHPHVNDRVFNKLFNNEFTISGWFQPYEPFDLFINAVSLAFSPSIIVSQDSQGDWFTTVDTHSKYITVHDIQTEIKPFDQRIRFFLGGGFIMKGLSVNNIIGFNIIGGIKKEYWSVYYNGYIDNTKVYKNAIGIIRYF